MITISLSGKILSYMGWDQKVTFDRVEGTLDNEEAERAFVAAINAGVTRRVGKHGCSYTVTMDVPAAKVMLWWLKSYGDGCGLSQEAAADARQTAKLADKLKSMIG